MPLNKLLAILAALFMVAADTCKAEPGKEVVELMEEPVPFSLFERGLKSLEKSVKNVVRLEPIQYQRIKGPVFEWMRPSVTYDEAADKLNLNFRLKTKDRNNWQDLCRNAVAFIKEMLTAGWDPENQSDVTFVGYAFLPYILRDAPPYKRLRIQEYSKADIRRSRYMDVIAHVIVIVQIENNPHDFTQCSSRLIASDISIKSSPR